MIDNGTIGTTQAKAAMESMFATGKSAGETVAELGLAQITDAGAIAEAVAQAIADNPQAVQDYMNGKETAAKFLVGQVMKVHEGQGESGRRHGPHR